mmetsp:Transcript_5086/g.7776  ORF Transcript_5086/g.7776 Transcript_5086/m.7776 type:complete len:1957 (-) Transcript_5086:199-6069(-)|eukprot:CAMPEP_0185022690 /NCGR_PEP_ID=MMETSP1103-20130426/5393_1 /TAXON_ID=36769 /ORGANISM="Paraphysomonas bandaiensis, Strain Caron Lab Isolate" /LENGTH=1956 /DNA_ID=CAMNT_0027554877 /DNA_START=18 /DNA_END=5888 /DNA_ORIENTATION=+
MKLTALISILWAATAHARCMNWCSKNGVCTDPGDAGYCICNNGYTGADCSRRICPKAFDATTVTDDMPRRAIRLTIGRESGKLEGRAALTYNGAQVLLDANPDNLSSEECTRIVRKMQGVGDATCVNERIGAEQTSSYSYLITFNSWSTTPFENNLFNHSGNPPLSAFGCNVDRVDEFKAIEPYCEVTDVVAENVPGYYECGNHGTCDMRIGSCICDRGFHGPACDDTTDTKDDTVVTHDGPFFTGTVLKAVAVRSYSEKFNFFQAALSYSEGDLQRPVTTIRGDKKFIHNGDMGVTGAVGMELPAKGSTLLSLEPSKNHAETRDTSSSVMVMSTAAQLSDTHLELRTFAPRTLNTAGEVSPLRTMGVLNITGGGDIHTIGKLTAANESFAVEDGLVTAQSINIVNSLDVHGSAVVEDSLTIGSGFALNPEGMTIDTNKHSGPLLELRSGQEQFNGSLLEINAITGDNSSMIRGIVDGVTTFDLTSRGNLSLAGVRMFSGGLEIDSGGVHISSGGLFVQGGLSVASGGLSLENTKLSAKSLHASGDDAAAPLLVVEYSNGDFTGNAFVIDMQSNEDDFSLIDAKVNDKGVFSVGGDGSLKTAGSITTASGLEVNEHARMKGGVSVAKLLLSAGDSISIPFDASFVDIQDDKSEKANIATLPTRPDGAFEGQIIIIHNSDNSVVRATTGGGELHIPVDCTVMLVYDGSRWVDVQALAAPLDSISNVKKFEVANDINIGNYTIEAGGFKLSSLNRGEIVVGGVGGLLRGRSGLSYMNGVLSAPGLKFTTLEADVDAKSKTISNAVIAKSIIHDASIVATDITLSKASGIAYFNQNGLLKASPSVALSEEGQLKITDLWDDIDFHEFNIRNAKSMSVESIEGVDRATIRHLFLGDEPSAGGIVHVTASGEIGFDSSMSFYDNTLHVSKLGSYAQSGAVDFNGNTLSNVSIAGGVAVGLSSISAESIVVSNLVDMTGATLSGASLKSVHLDASTQKAAKDSTVTIVGVDGKGELVVANGAIIRDAVVEAAGGSFKHARTELLELSGIQSALLSTDSKGTVIATKSATLDNVETGTLAVTGAASLSQLELATVSSSVLAVDSKGKVVPATDASFTSVKSESATVQGLSITGLKEAGMLMGTATGEVVSTENAELTSITTDISTVRGKLSAGSVQLLGSESGVLMADKDGLVSSVPTVHVDTVFSKTLNVEDAATLASLSISGLTTEGVLMSDSKGGVSSEADISLNSISLSKSLTANEGAFNTVRLGGLQSTLLAVDAEGYVSSADTLEVDSLTTAKVISGHGSFASLRIHGGKDFTAPSGVLTSNEGSVSVADTISVTNVNVADGLTVGGTAVLAALSFSSSQPGGVLTSDTQGAVTVSGDIDVNSITAKEATFSGVMSASELRSDVVSTLLRADEMGRVVPASSITVQSVSSDDLNVLGTASMQSLQLTGMKSSVLSVDANGKVVPASDSSLGSVRADSLMVEGRVSAAQLELKKLGVGVLSVDEAGTVSTSSNLHTDSMKAESINVAGDAHIGVVNAQSLILDSKAQRAGAELLVVGADGKVSSHSTVGSVSASQGSFNKLSVDGLLSAGGYRIIGDDTQVEEGLLISIDRQGYLRPTNEPSVPTLTIRKELTIDGSATVGSMKLPNVRSSLLATDGAGDIIAVDGVNVGKDGNLELKITSLRDDVSLDGNKITEAIIESSSVKNSNVYLSSNAVQNGGHIVVQDGTGLIGHSNKVEITKSGVLKVARISHIDDDGEVVLDRAQLKTATITDARISAVELTAEGLSTSGPAEFGSNVHIEGSLTVRGTVSGSGPYYDSSDRRFKTNISTISGALDMVSSLRGVTYDNKVDEYPDRKFSDQPQMGWIADEVESVIPELVEEDAQGYKHVAYSRAVAVLGEAIKELRDECKCTSTKPLHLPEDDAQELKRDIDVLRRDMEKLAKENEELRNMVKALIEAK